MVEISMHACLLIMAGTGYVMSVSYFALGLVFDGDGDRWWLPFVLPIFWLYRQRQILACWLIVAALVVTCSFFVVR